MTIKGINIPFSFSDTGGVQSTDPLNKVKINMQTVLTTLKGSRINEPQYGSELNKLLAEQNDAAFEILAKKEIKEAVSNWILDAEIQDVRIERENTSAAIYIKYFVTTFDVTDELLLLVES